MRPRLHSFGCAGAFHRAPSELAPRVTPHPQSTRALLGVNMCPLRALTIARMEPEYGVSVGPSSARPPGLRVRDDDEPQYQNLDELRKRPEYANLDEISREFGYRLCPEGQNLEDEAIYENILSVRQIRSAEVRLVPVSEVPYYEGQGYVATQVLSRNGTFPQCPPHTWSRLQHAGRMTGSLRLFTVNIYIYTFVI